MHWDARRVCTLFLIPTLPLLFIAAAGPAKTTRMAQTAAEKENIRHVRQLVGKRHGVITSDFSDAKQLAHTKWLLRRAGMTPEKYPVTFRSLDAAAVAHAKKKPANLSLLQASPQDNTTVYDYVDVVYLSTPDKVNYTAEGISTFANTTDSVTTTLQLYEAETLTPIGTPASQTTYAGNPAIVTLTASAAVESGYTGEVLAEVHSVVNSGGTTNGYTATVESVDLPANPPTVTQPVQANTNNEWLNTVKVCLGRSAQNSYNCDQCINGNSTCTTGFSNPPLQFNLAGTVTFNTAIQTPTTTNTTVTASIMPPTGGACTLNIPSASWITNALTTSNNNTTLSWNYSPTPSFGNADNVCWSSGNYVFITYTITVAETNGNSVDVNVNNLTATTCPPTGGQTPNSTPFCPVAFVWGCLAAETPITLADGTTKPVSAVGINEKVRGDAKGTTLTVTDTVIGDEKNPMIRIRDKAGDEVFVTGAHPMLTVNGVRLAKTLKTGDIVETIHGRSPITSIKQETYSGKVYNLVLGAGDAERARLNDDNRTMIAGGFVVGDNRMQTIHGNRFNSAPVNIMAKLPPRWHAEYKQWLADHPAAKK